MKNLVLSLIMAFGLCACGSSTSDAVAQSHTVNYGGGSFTVDQSQLNHPEKVSTRSFTTSAFEKMDTRVGVEVQYTQGSGDRAEVKVTVTKEYADYFVAKVKNGTMTLAWDQDRMRRELGDKKFKVAARVEITAPAFHKLEASTGANIVLDNGLDVRGKFEAELTSGAILTADNVRATEVELETNSGGIINASSIRCGKFQADVSAGAIINAKDVTATEEAELDASSGGVLNAGFTECRGQLKADVSSGAVVEISGKVNGEAKLDASSGGVIKASSVRARNSRVSTSSGGVVEKPSTK